MLLIAQAADHAQNLPEHVCVFQFVFTVQEDITRKQVMRFANCFAFDPFQLFLFRPDRLAAEYLLHLYRHIRAFLRQAEHSIGVHAPASLGKASPLRGAIRTAHASVLMLPVSAVQQLARFCFRRSCHAAAMGQRLFKRTKT